MGCVSTCFIESAKPITYVDSKSAAHAARWANTLAVLRGAVGPLLGPVCWAHAQIESACFNLRSWFNR
jgi:hypothetical protein